MQLQCALELLQLGSAQMLGADIDRRLLHGVDALLGPEIGFFLNAAQGRIPQTAPLAGSLPAVAHQHGDHLVGQTQIPGKAQQDLQLLRGQCLAQHPLNLAVKTAEALIPVQCVHHIHLRVGWPLSGHKGGFLLPGPQAQLAEHGFGAFQLSGTHM